MRPAPRIVSAALAFGLAAHPASLAAQVWEVDDRRLIAPDPAAFERFGSALAVGDFNADGLDDLAIAAPLADEPPVFDAVGRVDVFFALPGRGFAWAGELTGLIEDFCQTGTHLVAGDFDDAPPDELVSAAPHCGGGIVTLASFVGGQIETLHVSQGAISTSPGTPGDRFGDALARGDFNDDGYDDLAVGAPGEDLGGEDGVGMIHVVYGSATGLDLASAQTLVAADLVPGLGGAGDGFGAALAAGDFDADRYADLAIGAPGRTLSGQIGAGQLHVAFGSPVGITTAGDQLLDDASFGFAREPFDFFGESLAAGNFDLPGGATCLPPSGNCADDLAIGKPHEDVGATADAGHLIVARGEVAIGLSTVGALDFDQSDLGFNVETGDGFGAVLAAGRQDTRSPWDLERRAHDLAIGVPAEAYTLPGEGVAHLLFGSPAGLETTSSQFLASTPGWATHPPVAGGSFGQSMVLGDFDGDGVGDLAIGIPFLPVGNQDEAGAVQVLYGALFADGVERASLLGWSAASP